MNSLNIIYRDRIYFCNINENMYAVYVFHYLLHPRSANQAETPFPCIIRFVMPLWSSIAIKWTSLLFNGSF